VRAIWNGRVVAESPTTVFLEGNHYFPMSSVDRSVLRESDHHTTCAWKGEASYFSLEVDGERLEDAAFYYPEPTRLARRVTDRVAFWKGVDVRP
jgi:uncharacterized protein (DUF427 family)